MAGSGLNADWEVISENHKKIEIKKAELEFEQLSTKYYTYQYLRLVLGRMLDSLPIRAKIFEVYERAVVS